MSSTVSKGDHSARNCYVPSVKLVCRLFNKPIGVTDFRLGATPEQDNLYTA